MVSTNAFDPVFFGTRTIGGGSTLALYGQNTFEEPLIIGDNTNNNLRLRFNTATDFDGGPSSLGAPLTAANGIIQIGSISFGSTMEFINAGAAQSTNRRIRIGSSSNGSGGATILNNNPNPAHSLTFTSPSFNVAATGITNTNHVLSLGGSNLGSNTISGSIIDNVGGSGGRVALTKNGTGTWLLAGANSYSNNTNVNAGTLKIGADNVLPSGAGKGNVNGNASDTIIMTAGSLTATGLTINVNPAGAGLTEAEYVLVDATVGGTITGSFAGLTGAPGYELSYGTANLIKLVSVSATPYETWADGALFGDDENGDGVSNGLAFLLGAADPNQNALDLLPTATESGGGLVLSFNMRNATARGDATLTLQHSRDLGITDPWTSVAVPDTSGGPISGVAFTVTPGDPLNTVVATIDSSQAASGKLFARLQAGNP